MYIYSCGATTTTAPASATATAICLVEVNIERTSENKLKPNRDSKAKGERDRVQFCGSGAKV